MSEQTADKLEITDLLYRYAELIDAGDFDGVGRLLARSTFGGPASGSVSGAENIANLFAMTTRRYADHGSTPRTRHLVRNPIVELNGDGTAATRRADVDPLRHRRPGRRARLSAHLRGGIHRPHRARRAARGRTLPSVGARHIFNTLVIAYFGDLRVRHGR